MQGSEIEAILLHLPTITNHFVGVFSIDTLPKNLKRRTFIICNTAEQSKPGEHWICICKTDFEIEVFDSLGIDLSKKNLLLRFCKFKNTKHLKINETPFQSSTTSTCGLFAIYFSIQRFHNLDLSFKTLLHEIFSKDILYNEEKVKTFVSNLPLRN